MNIGSCLYVINAVADSTGKIFFSPESLPHVYTYNTDNTVATDTVTDGTNTWTKTFTYTSGNMTAETAWVLQSID